MKYFLIAFLFLSACSNKAVSKQAVPEAQLEEEGLILIEAYQRFTSGGKERADGKQASTNFSIVTKKKDEVTIESVLIYGIEHPYEGFEYEGQFYLMSKVYSDANMESMNSQTEVPGKVLYTFNGEAKQLIIEEFEIKEPVTGN